MCQRTMNIEKSCLSVFQNQTNAHKRKPLAFHDFWADGIGQLVLHFQWSRKMPLEKGCLHKIVRNLLLIANLAVWFAVSVLIELSSNIPTQTNEHILGRVCRKSSFIAAHVVHSEWKMCDSPMHSTSPQQTKQRLSDVRFPTLQNFHICLGSVKRAQNQRGFRWQSGCGRKTLSTVH